MAFSMKNFVKRGLLNAVGKQADYLIIRNATGWHEKGVLELSDLEEIQNALNAQGNIAGDVTREFPTPETVAEIPPTDEEISGLAPESGGVTDE